MTEDRKIILRSDDGEEIVYFVEEETRVSGTSYLLVSDSDEGEANAYILKDTSADGEDEAAYVVLEDPVEFEAVSGIFRQMLDDVEFR